nr:3-ketoacyl-(acyl-carrier-protein) reductase [Klebsiella pneumoniae]
MLAMNRGNTPLPKPRCPRPPACSLPVCAKSRSAYMKSVRLIKTEMTIPATAYYDELIAKGLVPWGRWGFPADIASTVRAMAEGKLIYTCGRAVAIDGGLSMPRF